MCKSLRQVSAVVDDRRKDPRNFSRGESLRTYINISPGDVRCSSLSRMLISRVGGRDIETAIRASRRARY